MHSTIALLIAGLLLPLVPPSAGFGRNWPRQISTPPVLIAQSSDLKALSEKAKTFTVRIDGTGDGSGAIIGRRENIYTVLTNWHVVSSSGVYQITTIDRQSHTVIKKQKLPNLDLAILTFESTRNYAVAPLGNSNTVRQTVALAISGYPSKAVTITKQRSHQFLPNQPISGLLPEGDIEGGYTFTIQGTTLPGMSGSPIINGKAEIIAVYGAASALGQLIYAIPINKAKQAANQAGIPINFPSNATIFSPVLKSAKSIIRQGYCTFLSANRQGDILDNPCTIYDYADGSYQLKWSDGILTTIIVEPTVLIDDTPATIVRRGATTVTVKGTKGNTGFCWNCNPRFPIPDLAPNPPQSPARLQPFVRQGYCTFLHVNHQGDILDDPCTISYHGNNTYLLKWSDGISTTIILGPNIKIDDVPGTLVNQTSNSITVKSPKGNTGFCWNCRPG